MYWKTSITHGQMGTRKILKFSEVWSYSVVTFSIKKGLILHTVNVCIVRSNLYIHVMYEQIWPGPKFENVLNLPAFSNNWCSSYQCFTVLIVQDFTVILATAKNWSNSFSSTIQCTIHFQSNNKQDFKKCPHFAYQITYLTEAKNLRQIRDGQNSPLYLPSSQNGCQNHGL